MERSLVVCPDIVIANGAVNSNSVLYAAYADADAFSLFFASGDATKTYKFQLSYDNGVTWLDWYDGVSVIAAPVSQASTYGNPSAQAFRLVASGATGSLTTFKMQKTVVN